MTRRSVTECEIAPVEGLLRLEQHRRGLAVRGRSSLHDAHRPVDATHVHEVAREGRDACVPQCVRIRVDPLRRVVPPPPAEYYEVLLRGGVVPVATLHGFRVRGLDKRGHLDRGELVGDVIRPLAAAERVVPLELALALRRFRVEALRCRTASPRQGAALDAQKPELRLLIEGTAWAQDGGAG